MVQNDLDCFRSEVIEHLEASEHRQSAGASCSSNHSCSHPCYDDDDDDYYSSFLHILETKETFI
jgi:hypothetical protein